MSGNIKGQSDEKASLVYFSIGSNIGDRLNYLNKARTLIESNVGKLKKASSIYISDAWGKEDQASFLNQVLIFETKYSPFDILNRIQSIENEMGRKRQEKWGSRTIDIDILFYNDKIINEIGLIIPHPEIANRQFVLQPLLEVSPNFVHTFLKKSIKVLSKECGDTSKVALYIS